MAANKQEGIQLVEQDNKTSRMVHRCLNVDCKLLVLVGCSWVTCLWRAWSNRPSKNTASAILQQAVPSQLRMPVESHVQSTDLVAIVPCSSELLSRLRINLRMHYPSRTIEKTAQ